MEKKVLWILVFLILVFSVFAGNYLNFSEDFGNYDSLNQSCTLTDMLVSSNFDNNWYCGFVINDGVDSMTLLSNGNSSYYKTNKSVNLKVYEPGGATVSNGFIKHYFSEPVDFLNQTTFNFTCYEDGYEYQYLVFRYANFIPSISLSLSDFPGSGATPCSVINSGMPQSSINNSECCVIADLGYDCAGGATLSFTIGDIRDSCGFTDSNLSDLGTIEFHFMSTYTDAHDNYFDDILITNLFNGSNYLPYVNFSFQNENGDISEYICINSSNDTREITLNISVFDSENDTIYYGNFLGDSEDYGIIDVNFYDYYVSVSPLGYQFKRCSSPNAYFCHAFPNFNFVDNIIYPDNQCRINTGSISGTAVVGYNDSMLNLVTTPNFLNNSAYMLLIDSVCFGKPEYYYYIPEDLTDFDYGSYFKNLDAGDSFNLSFLDSIYNPIVEFRFNNTGSRFLIYSKNESYEILVVNESVNILRNNNFFGFDLTVLNTNPSIYLHYENLANDTLYNILFNITPERYLKYIKVSVNNGSWILQDSFSYSGSIIVPEFSTIKPQTVTVSDFGLLGYTLYVSDSSHVPNDYVKKTEYISVGSCDIIPESNVLGETAKTNYCPTFKNQYVNGIICAFRVPAILGIELGTMSILNDLILMVLIFYGFQKYRKEISKPDAKSDEIIKNIIVEVFLLSIILYVVFLIGHKSVFVSISLLGLMFLGNLFNEKILNLRGQNSEMTIFMSTLGFIILSAMYFSLIQVATSVDFGINFNMDSNVHSTNSIVTKIFYYVGTLINFFTFSIPNIPGFLNFIIMILRLASIVSLLIYGYEKANPLN